MRDPIVLSFEKAIQLRQETLRAVEREYDQEPAKFFPFWRRPPVHALTRDEILGWKERIVEAETDRRLVRALRKRGVPT